MDDNLIIVSEKLHGDSFCSSGVPAAEIHISRPEFTGGPSAARLHRLNRFYEHDAEKLTRYVKKRLFPAAVSALEESVSLSRPFYPWSISMDYKITLNNGALLSLYRDITVQTDRKYRARLGETWDIMTGWPVFLSDFFPRRQSCKKQLIRYILNSLPREPGELSFYKAGYKKLIRQNFNKENFYLKGDTLVIYYQPGVLADTSCGVCEFSLDIKAFIENICNL